MVSAVFHAPREGALAPQPATAPRSHAPTAIAEKSIQASDSGQKNMKNENRSLIDWRAVALVVVPPVLGFGLLVGLWALVSISTGSSIPGPVQTWGQAVDIFSNPFYRNGPNDQGVGWNVLMSLERVAVGFGLAAAVGIPAGFAIGRFTFLGRMFNPLIGLLRPVSPLACWCSRGPTRPPSGPSSFAASGP